MRCREIYNLYFNSQPKNIIHQAFREVAVDDIDEMNDDRTPLHLACQYGDIEAVRILLDRDTEINPKDANGDHPLFLS